MSDTIHQIDRHIRRDPARRGLIGSEPTFGPLCAGHLQRAADDLAVRARRVGIVSGFYIPQASPPAAETDGPPGAAFLADVLQAMGIETVLVTDPLCAPAMLAAVSASGLDESKIHVPPTEEPDWCSTFLAAQGLSHLIAVERVGPCHTTASAREQNREKPFDESTFTASVGSQDQDTCRNMRGVNIDEFTAPLHELFEQAARFNIHTTGIGDGGNEIGMGNIPWEELTVRLPGPNAGMIPCRIRTDTNIIAGVSNWGAWALGAAIAVRCETASPLESWTYQRQATLIERLVEDGPAVDGVTKQREATVDGLPLATYLGPWLAIRKTLGIPPAE